MMIRINRDYYAQDGQLYILKPLKPTKYGYRVLDSNGKRIYVTEERVRQIEADKKKI